MSAAEIIAALAAALPGVAVEPLEAADSAVTPTIGVPREAIVAVCEALQGPGLEYVAFSDVTAVDFHPHRDPRFDVVYHLVSPHRRARVRLRSRRVHERRTSARRSAMGSISAACASSSSSDSVANTLPNVPRPRKDEVRGGSPRRGVLAVDGETHAWPSMRAG